MSGSEIYYLWMKIAEYVKNSDRDEALYVILNDLLQNDEELVMEFYDASIEDDNVDLMPLIRNFLIENELYEEEDW